MLGPGRQYARRISLVFSVKLEFCRILYMTWGGSEPSLLVWKMTPTGSRRGREWAGTPGDGHTGQPAAMGRDVEGFSRSQPRAPEGCQG